MDISAINSLYAGDSAYLPFSVSRPTGDPPAGEFARLLEKSAEQNTGTAEPPGESLPSLGIRRTLVDKNDKLYEQCEALETFLVKNLLKSMRSTVQKSGLLDTGFAGEMYEDMLYDEYAKDFTKNAGFGFAELAYLELTGQRGALMAGRG
jgi:flagellar protein FlgJ